MSTVSELIRAEGDGTISFGDYTLSSKSKKDNFDHDGDIYKIKTYNEITKLEKNGMFVYESVPGTAVNNFYADSDKVSFYVQGPEDASVTLELEPESEYEVKVDGADSGTMKTNLGGKVNLSVELDPEVSVFVEVIKK